MRSKKKKNIIKVLGKTRDVKDEGCWELGDHTRDVVR